MYLIATDLPKVELVRAQSLSFLLGSLVLLLAHLRSGVLNPVTLPASAWMVLPTMVAMFVGYRVHDRLDQGRFQQADPRRAGAVSGSTWCGGRCFRRMPGRFPRPGNHPLARLGEVLTLPGP